MKRPSSAYTLIKSLTMSEKRYFKIFSERHTIGLQNKYILLFDLLEKQNKEDDLLIIRTMNKAGIQANYLSADKNYLYNVILRCLNDFNHCKTFNLQIKESLTSIELLFHKGLYPECLKLIQRTKSLAEECENFQLLIDLLMWEKRCSGYSLGLKKASEVNSRITHYINIINNTKKLTDLYYTSNVLQAGQENYPKAEVLKKFKLILQEPELKSETSATSFTAKIHYYLIYSNYYNYTGNRIKELHALEKLVTLINQSKTYPVEYPLDYISIYNRLLSIKIFFKSSSFFDDINTLNNFSKKVHIRQEVVKLRVYIHTNTHEMEYYLINGDFSKGLSKIKELEKNSAILPGEIEPYHMVYFYYLHALILTHLGKNEKALGLINSILNRFSFESRPQIFLKAELLGAMIHYDLKNYPLVISFAGHSIKKNLTPKLLSTLEDELAHTLIRVSKRRQLTKQSESLIWQNLLSQNPKRKDTVTITNQIDIEHYDKWIISKIKKQL